MDNELRALIREIIEDTEELDEFSGVASIAGVTTPLGTNATYPGKKKKNMKEASTVLGSSLGAMMDKDFDGIIDDRDPDVKSVEQRYLEAIAALSRAYGNAPSPIKTIKDAKKHYEQRRP